MFIIIDDDQYDIDDIYIEYSPFFNALKSSKWGENYMNVDGDDIYILDFSEYGKDAVKNYINFITGEDFTMTSEEEELFSFMGHNNVMNYPIEFWKIKLREMWIKDNFNKLELYKDKFYGLKEIEISERKLYGFIPHTFLIGDIPFGQIVHSKIPRFESITITSTEKESLQKLISTSRDPRYDSEHNVVEIDYFKFLIPKIYRSPAEIVYDLAIDCECMILDTKTKKIWASQRCLYALKNKINYFDLSIVKDEDISIYIERILDYRKRGFHLVLPNITINHININEVHKFMRDMVYITVDGFNERYSFSKLSNNVFIKDKIRKIYRENKFDADDEKISRITAQIENNYTHTEKEYMSNYFNTNRYKNLFNIRNYFSSNGVDLRKKIADGYYLYDFLVVILAYHQYWKNDKKMSYMSRISHNIEYFIGSHSIWHIDPSSCLLLSIFFDINHNLAKKLINYKSIEKNEIIINLKYENEFYKRSDSFDVRNWYALSKFYKLYKK